MIKVRPWDITFLSSSTNFQELELKFKHFSSLCAPQQCNFATNAHIIMKMLTYHFIQFKTKIEAEIIEFIFSWKWNKINHINIHIYKCHQIINENNDNKISNLW